MKFEMHIDVQAEAKIVDLLAAELSTKKHLSKPEIKALMTKGAVWLESKQRTGVHRVRRADKRAAANDTVHLYYDENVLNQQPQVPELIADEGEYSLWYKPRGMLCQGSKWADHCTIHRWVESHYQPQKPVFIVHRLDKAASGLILLAHKKKTAAYFAGLFQTRDIRKHYQAIVAGEFPSELEIDSPVDGKPAYSHVNLVKYDAATNQSLLDIRIETGRKHQIRRHLAEAGFPICGDAMYGNTKPEEELKLRSYLLAFICPKETLEKQFSLPETLALQP